MATVNKQRFCHGNPNFIEVVVAYGLAVKKGDMLQLTAANIASATLVVNAADNDTFFAIADQEHVALTSDDSKVHKIRCIIPDPSCVFRYPLGTACNVLVGQGLAIAGPQSLDMASTDHVAVAVEKADSASGMEVDVVFCTPVLWGGASKNVSYTAP